MYNKKGLIRGSFVFIFLAFALLSVFLISSNVSAAKSERYFLGPKQCEPFQDSVLWSAIGTKSGGTASNFFTWTPENDCIGTKSCDMINISSYVRYLNTGTKDSNASGLAFARIANTSGNASYPRNYRFVSYLNQVLVAGDSLGPRYECGSISPNTCNTTNQG